MLTATFWCLWHAFFVPCPLSGHLVAGPTLDDITDSVCAAGNFYKCLPYGECYDFQSYCSDKSRAVNPCFPHEIAQDDASLLKWCQEQIASNISLTPHPSCKHACVDKFGVTTLYQSLPYQNENPFDNTWVILSIGILTCCLIVSVIVNVLLCVREHKTGRRRISMTTTENDADKQDDEIRAPKHNSEESIEEKRQEPGAPPTVDNRETDIAMNQPVLNDRNMPSSMQLNCVQVRSTQNGQAGHQFDHEQGTRTRSTQNGRADHQFDHEQGTSTRNVQNGRAGHQFDHDQGTSTRNVQNGRAVFDPQTRVSVTSSSSVSFTRDVADASAESAPLIPRSHATESDNHISARQFQTGLRIHTNATVPGREGNHPVITNKTQYE